MYKKPLIAALVALPSAALAVDMSLPTQQESVVPMPDVQKKEDVFIEADQIDYDSKGKVVSAAGKVEILKGENVLFADNVIYDQSNDTVTAEGNVSVVGADGNAVFTDKFVLKDEFKNGVVNFFRARLSDGSLLAAARAEKAGEEKTILDKAVYSPCPICTADPDSNPQWQLKASKVTVDNVKEQVEYEDATMEVYGVPILYTPYFWHATGNSPRESGFMMPSLKTDSNLGVAVTTPYFWNIAPNADITFEPMFTTKEGPVAAGELRHLTKYGKYQLSGSITQTSDASDLSSNNNKVEDTRGHLMGEGRFDLTENWDVGFDGEYASDDTYLRRYNYGNQDMLTSRAYFERQKDRNYSIVQTVHFQGLLEEDDSKTIPLALPYFQNHFETEKGIIPAFGGSKIYADFSGFAISREFGDDNQRTSLNTGLNIPFVTTGGHIFEFDTKIRADQYNLEQHDNKHPHRMMPEASVTWKFPLMNQITNNGKLLVEPIAKLVTAPNKDYNKDIPNEDSQDVEFSDLNVFDNNRFRGLDRVESGTRAYYGLRGGYYEDSYNISYVFGQNYRLQEPNSVIPVNSGIEDNKSDYVGRISASFYNTLDVSYKFRFDSKNFSARRNEVDADLNLKPFYLSLTYFKLDYDFTNPSDNREEINGVAKINVTEDWSVLFGGTRNLAEDTNIDAEGGLLYEGDCVNIMTTLRKEFISDRDAKSGTSFNIKLGLKNLGEI